MRIIARIDIKGPNLIKGYQMEGLRIIGDPNLFCIKYYLENIDEIILLDTVATLYGRNNLIEIIKKSTEEVFIPIIAGGGIRTLSDAKKLFNSGADKIYLNTGGIENPELISQLSDKYGSQSIIVSLEAKKKSHGIWHCYSHNGREDKEIEVGDWINKVQSLGAGEIFVTSIDCDGSMKILDKDLINYIKNITKVPLIYGGGFSSLNDIDYFSDYTICDGIAIGASLHYNKLKIDELKLHMNKKGFSVRF